VTTTVLPRGSLKVLDTGMHYKVRNNTDKRLTTGDGRTDLLRWNKIAYRCEPGETTLVPWPVIALYFGDPRSQHGKTMEAEDSQGKHQVPSRGNELLRLSVYYGTYEHQVDILTEVIPDVSIFTLDDVEIIPPCFDPEGEYLYGYQRSAQKSQDVATMIQELRDQAQAMELRLAEMEANGDNDSEIPRDEPPQPLSIPA
jgi:hypothetical protein